MAIRDRLYISHYLLCLREERTIDIIGSFIIIIFDLANDGEMGVDWQIIGHIAFGSIEGRDFVSLMIDIDFEMSLSLASYFLDADYIGIFEEEERFLVPLSKGFELRHFMEGFIVPLMSLDSSIECEYFLALCCWYIVVGIFDKQFFE